MKVISEQQAVTLFPALKAPWAREDLCLAQSKLSADSGLKNSFVHALSSKLELQSEACLSVTERGVWPSSEDSYLFDKLIEFTTGQSTDLYYPSLLFAKAEKDLAMGFMRLCLFNFWGFSFTFDDQEFVLTYSHDDFFSVYAPKRETAELWMRYLA